MEFGPKKIEFRDVLVNSLGSLIAGFIGSIVILIITFISSSIVNIPNSFSNIALVGAKTSSIFPIVLSIITLIGTSITIFLTYYLLNFTNSERYKKNLTILGQISLFGIFLYIFFTPVYIFVGIKSYENILLVFLVHASILTFGTSLILEILNNYRYVLLGFYGSFIGIFFSSIITILIFFSMTTGFAKLVAILALLPIINLTTTFFKQIFELIYFHYYKFTNLDQLGDIFYQIEVDENEKVRNGQS